MRYLFVGEKRSDQAKAMGVVWADGRLAAKQLFDALKAAGIEPRQEAYTNWYERNGYRDVRTAYIAGYTIVALGRKVHAELSKRGIAHLELVHPAARGAIRKKERYCAHVRGVLRETA